MKAARFAIPLALLIGGGLLAVWLLQKPREPLQADRILVEKEKRRMTLYFENRPVRTYRISLGRDPIGPKTQEGDQKTPEGVYFIEGRNPESTFHLSLRISYPNAADTAQAEARGVPAGFDIMIHGLPNRTANPGSARWREDWTAGCIAVTDAEIEEIWAAVPDGVPVEIRP